MAFSVFVELLNLRVRGPSKPVRLHQAYEVALTHKPVAARKKGSNQPRHT